MKYTPKVYVRIAEGAAALNHLSEAVSVLPSRIGDPLRGDVVLVRSDVAGVKATSDEAVLAVRTLYTATDTGLNELRSLVVELGTQLAGVETHLAERIDAIHTLPTPTPKPTLAPTPAPTQPPLPAPSGLSLEGVLRYRDVLRVLAQVATQALDATPDEPYDGDEKAYKGRGLTKNNVQLEKLAKARSTAEAASQLPPDLAKAFLSALRPFATPAPAGAPCHPDRLAEVHQLIARIAA